MVVLCCLALFIVYQLFNHVHVQCTMYMYITEMFLDIKKSKATKSPSVPESSPLATKPGLCPITSHGKHSGVLAAEELCGDEESLGDGGGGEGGSEGGGGGGGGEGGGEGGEGEGGGGEGGGERGEGGGEGEGGEGGGEGEGGGGGGGGEGGEGGGEGEGVGGGGGGGEGGRGGSEAECQGHYREDLGGGDGDEVELCVGKEGTTGDEGVDQTHSISGECTEEVAPCPETAEADGASPSSCEPRPMEATAAGELPLSDAALSGPTHSDGVELPLATPPIQPSPSSPPSTSVPPSMPSPSPSCVVSHTPSSPSSAAVAYGGRLMEEEVENPLDSSMEDLPASPLPLTPASTEGKRHDLLYIYIYI